MSAKVDTENATVEVPEASPDANDEKKDVHVAEAKLRSRRNLWIGLAVFLAVVLSLSIALPLSLKKGDSNERNENEVTTETNGEQAQPFGEPETPCAPPSPDNHCITQESHEQCMTLVNIGCKKIKSTRSCPPMHVCDDVVPGLNPAVQCPPPSPDNHCTTEESHQQCMTLVNSGCKKIRSTRSCPPMHQCDETPEQPEAVACTMDVKECADGSFVGRVAPNCDFEMCPGEVPVVAACTLELAYCPDGTPVGRSAPNCHFEACAGGACPMGTYTCDDGTELVRDPALGCEYPQCSTSPVQTNQESTPVACTLELKTCSDGSSVGRTGPNCEFESCPEDLQLAACTMELAYCPDGKPVGRSGPNCHFEACAEGACPMGTYTCDDGTVMVRDPVLGCEYPSCPQTADVACPMDVKECPNGSFVARTGPSCEFKECPQEMLVACTMDLGICPGGESVGRTAPNCDFERCPDGLCTVDTFRCDDGTEVSRDPDHNCQFHACP